MLIPTYLNAADLVQDGDEWFILRWSPVGPCQIGRPAGEVFTGAIVRRFVDVDTLKLEITQLKGEKDLLVAAAAQREKDAAVERQQWIDKVAALRATSLELRRKLDELQLDKLRGYVGTATGCRQTYTLDRYRLLVPEEIVLSTDEELWFPICKAFFPSIVRSGCGWRPAGAGGLAEGAVIGQNLQWSRELLAKRGAHAKDHRLQVRRKIS